MSNLLVKLVRGGLVKKSVSAVRVRAGARSGSSEPAGRPYSGGRKESEGALSTVAQDGRVSADVKTVVKETTKTVSYVGVILAGIAVTTVMFYTIFSELFSGKSPSGVYSRTLERCVGDNRIRDALGEPIKGFGEETKRGRRRYTRHVIYLRDGVEHLRMRFYLKGTRNRATVHLEMKEGGSGDYVYRYLFVQLDDYTQRVIVLEDNRLEKSLPLAPPIDFSAPLNLS